MFEQKTFWQKKSTNKKHKLSNVYMEIIYRRGPIRTAPYKKHLGKIGDFDGAL